MTKKLVVAALAALGMLAACSSNAPKENSQTSQAAPAKPAASQETQMETGREAFQRLYATARLWQPDAQPFRLQSLGSGDAVGHDGKAPIWSAGFASPSRRTMKVFTWSGLHDPNAPAFGVSSNVEDSYSPSNSSTLVFDIAFLKSDSGTAFDEAQKHGGDKILKKTPKTPIYYNLDWQPRLNSLYWHVSYGSGEQTLLRVAVDATKGTFVRTEH